MLRCTAEPRASHPPPLPKTAGHLPAAAPVWGIVWRTSILVLLLTGPAAADYSIVISSAIHTGLLTTDTAGNLYFATDRRSAHICGEYGRPVFQGGNGVTTEGCPQIGLRKTNPEGTATIYHMQFSTSLDDYLVGATVDNDGNAYLVGFTGSGDFPATPGSAYSRASFRVFVAKLDPEGKLVYSATFPTARDATLNAQIQVDRYGQLYMSGDVPAADFPIVNPIQTATTSGAFLLKLNSTGTADLLDFSWRKRRLGVGTGRRRGSLCRRPLCTCRVRHGRSVHKWDPRRGFRPQGRAAGRWNRVCERARNLSWHTCSDGRSLGQRDHRRIIHWGFPSAQLGGTGAAQRHMHHVELVWN